MFLKLCTACMLFIGFQMHYFGSNNQFVSFSASKAVTSFLLYISNVEVSQCPASQTLHNCIDNGKS